MSFAAAGADWSTAADGKLDVADRDEAVARATDTGLLCWACPANRRALHKLHEQLWTSSRA